MRRFLQWVDLWAYMGAVLIGLIEITRPILNVGSTVAWAEPWPESKGERELMCTHFPYSLLLDPESCFTSCLEPLPSYFQATILSPETDFVREFYHSSQKKKKKKGQAPYSVFLKIMEITE